MNEVKTSLAIRSLAEPIRALLVAAFILFGKMGWITFATPEAMHGIVNAIMDFLVAAVPIGYAIWLWIKSIRQKTADVEAARPENIVAKAAALPEVTTIVTTPAIARKVDDPATVVTQ